MSDFVKPHSGHQSVGRQQIIELLSRRRIALFLELFVIRLEWPLIGSLLLRRYQGCGACSGKFPQALKKWMEKLLLRRTRYLGTTASNIYLRAITIKNVLFSEQTIICSHEYRRFSPNQSIFDLTAPVCGRIEPQHNVWKSNFNPLWSLIAGTHRHAS